VNAAGRLAAFAAGLAAVSAGAAVVGGAVDPDVGDADQPSGHVMQSRNRHAADSHNGEPDKPASAVAGLAVAADGYRLELRRSELPRGKRAGLAFRITDRRGEAVNSFAIAHDKRMHLIVVRRDGRGFQHVHPTMTRNGTWSIPLTIRDAGAYRVFADFKIGRTAHTLGADLAVDGRAIYTPLPRPAATAKTASGFDVRLQAGKSRAGKQAGLRFTVSRAGRVVHTERYLAARGHLVALREGDLGYLHTHPAGHRDTAGSHDDAAVSFETDFPTAGRYRLYFQFQVGGRVHTAVFTREALR
jgi:hypothetical protein